MRQAGMLSTFVLVLAPAACSDALEQTTSAGQVVVTVNRVSRSLSLLSVDDRSVISLPMPVPLATPSSAAVVGSLLAVPATDAGSLAVFDFSNGRPPAVQLLGLPSGSGATGIAITSDSIAWVPNPNRNTVTRVDLRTGRGDTASFATGPFPQAAAVVGGLIFIANGNSSGGSPAGPSWITVRSATTGALAAGDSIPLTGTNARFITAGLDGLLYVVDAGTPGLRDGKLSIVDPATRTEQVVVNGLGDSPGRAVYHPSGRLLIASLSEGILEMSTSTRVLLHGAGNGIKPQGSGVAALTLDERGRVYAVDQRDCAAAGVVHVLAAPPDYADLEQIPVGVCPVAAVTILVP